MKWIAVSLLLATPFGATLPNEPSEPAILVIVDTSSSMAGQSIADANAAVAAVVAASPGVNWGLQRFGQTCTGTCACTATGVDGSCTSGGCDAQEPVVEFAAGSGSTVLSWVDGSCNFAGGLPEIVVPAGTAYTPLGASLLAARTYIGAFNSGDRLAACRPRRVVLITDGVETCCGNPVDAAGSLLADVGTPTHVVALGLAPGSASIDAIAAAGGTSTATYVADATEAAAALTLVVADAALPTETCNGVDDDCDLLVDEGFPVGDPCSVGVGACSATGTLVCTVDGTGTECSAVPGTPSSEICGDLVDSDCDGALNNGCECLADADCGGATSGSLCEGWACVSGCRSAGGNGCPAGMTCSSTDATVGTCSAPPEDPPAGCSCGVATTPAAPALILLAVASRRRRARGC